MIKKIISCFVFLGTILCSEFKNPIKVVNIDNFEQEILNSSLPVFLNVSVSWCPPCQLMDSLFQDITDCFEGRAIFAQGIILHQEDQDLLRFLFEKFSVLAMGFPLVVVFVEGKYKHHLQGCPQSKDDLIKTFENILIEIKNKDA